MTAVAVPRAGAPGGRGGGRAARCARVVSTTSSARSERRSSSRSRSRRRRRAARRSTTSCSSGRPGSARRRSPTIVREELGVGLRTVAGPALERKGDMAAILTGLEARDVLFIDEIHRVNRAIEEILYPALEDFRLDIIVGQGAGARTLTLDLPPFTLVGATTRTGLLTTPLRDRFGMTFRLGYYEPDELTSIVRRSAGILGVEIEGNAAEEIAARARGTPRVANRILRRVRDVAQVRHAGVVTVDDRARGARAARGRRGRARAHRPRAPRRDRAQVRRRPGRALDARGLARRGAGHDRGRLRAVPAPARLPPADAARTRHHRARPRRTSAPPADPRTGCSRREHAHLDTGDGRPARRVRRDDHSHGRARSRRSTRCEQAEVRIELADGSRHLVASGERRAGLRVLLVRAASAGRRGAAARDRPDRRRSRRSRSPRRSRAERSASRRGRR